MKKRLLCLVLCTVMLLGTVMFTGCSTTKTDDDVAEEASRSTKTLNMFLMTEKGTTAEAAKAVEDAVNKITKSNFKTKINMSFYTEDEYYAALEKAFIEKEEETARAEAAAKALKKFIKENKEQYGQDGAKAKFYELYPEYQKYAETTTDPTAETTVEETIFNSDTGLLELKYPEADPNVIDIFFLSDYDRFLDYIEKEWVARVDEELTSGSKKLNDYISSVFMKSVQIDKATYAIPNNRTIGEYTYMLVNKELLAKYYYNIDTFASLADCGEFLEDIVKFEQDVVPISGSPELYNVLYWNIDPDTLEIKKDDFSVIGSTYSKSATLGTNLQFASLFTKKVYRDQLLTNKRFEELGYFVPNAPEDAKCAVKIVKGGAELEKIYGDTYEMVVIESPQASYDTIFGSMFAVGGYSNEVSRAMEIITYINTNPDLRNIIQYGIEGVNYTLDDNKQVVYTDDNAYWMDINKTGNSFIAYQLAGTDPDIWKYGMKQNRDATVDMILGFNLKTLAVDTNAIKAIQEISAGVKARIDACTTYDELAQLIDALSDEMKAQKNATIKSYTMPQVEPVDGLSMPYVLFYEWMTDMGFIVEE